MINIKLWLVKNKFILMVAFISVGILSLSAVSLVAAKTIHQTYLNEQLLSACDEAYKMLCVQVHACTNAPVKECDAFVKRENLCGPVESLPMVDIIDSCIDDLRHINCQDQLPGTCQTFMDK